MEWSVSLEEGFLVHVKRYRYQGLPTSSVLLAAVVLASAACGQNAGGQFDQGRAGSTGQSSSGAGALPFSTGGSTSTGGGAALGGGAGGLTTTGGASVSGSAGATEAGGSPTGVGGDASRDCPAAAEASLFGGPVDHQVAVAWNVVQRTISPMAYGMNGFNAFDPLQTSDPAYLASVLHMKPGIVRLHNMAAIGDSAQSPGGWIDSVAKTWDAPKIAKALKPLADAGLNLMINIPHWPDWMDTNSDLKLDSDKFDAFATLMADLVRIVNVENKLNVKYWEVTNELEYRFELLTKPEQMSQVVDLYNRACKAMKVVDPTILTGGPATSRADLKDLVGRFARGTASQANPTTLDFFTFHSYGGDGRNSDDDAYTAAAKWVGGYGSSLSQILADASPARKIPLWYDEFAVTYDWQSKDPRTTSNKGAVWDALAITSALDNGVDWTSSWNEKDGFYGKMDPDNKLRVTAELYYLMNNWLVGQRVESRSDKPDDVAAFAVANGDRHAVLLINRRDSARVVGVAMSGWTPSATESAVVSQIDATGFRRNTAAWANLSQGLNLPAHAVVLIASADPQCL